MSQNKFLVMLAGAALGLGASGALAQSDSQNAYAAELSADAVAKTQYMAKANGFSITDGTNKLRVSGFTQFRYNLNFRDDPSVGPGHDSGFTNGFELPRTRIAFTGNVLDPNLLFKIEGQFSDSSDGNFGLLDAFAGYKYSDELSMFAGQFQVPLLRDWYLSPYGSQSEDISIVTDIFNPGYSQGIWGVYQADAFKAIFAFDDGANAANTTYYSNGAEADWGLTLRMEGKLSGDWNRFNDMSSWKSDSGMATMIGGGLHWQHNGNTAAPGGGSQAQGQFVEYTIDASFEFGGANLYAAFVGAHTDPDSGGGKNTDDFGFEIQGGFFVAEQDELYARLDWVIPDSDRPDTGDDDFYALTLGYNHYLVPDSNAAKFSTELMWCLNEPSKNDLVSSTSPSSQTGLLPDGGDNQVLLRFQFQLAF